MELPGLQASPPNCLFLEEAGLSWMPLPHRLHLHVQAFTQMCVEEHLPPLSPLPAGAQCGLGMRWDGSENLVLSHSIPVYTGRGCNCIHPPLQHCFPKRLSFPFSASVLCACAWFPGSTEVAHTSHLASGEQ